MQPAAALLLAAQVDVSVQLLAVLRYSRGAAGQVRSGWLLEVFLSSILYVKFRHYLLHEQIILSGTLVDFELEHGDV